MEYIAIFAALIIGIWALKMEVKHTPTTDECSACGRPQHPRNLRNGRCYACNKKLAKQITGVEI